MKNLRKKQRSAGFSIIELLLVLVILGVLAGIVITNFSGTSEKANITAANSEMKNISTALKSYEIEMGKFPSDAEGLDALSEMPNGADEDKWRRFMDEKVGDDPWGNPYVYKYPGTHNNDFDLYSFGPDGKEGGDDDITNWSKDED